MERKWEELKVDCLINVFKKLEIQDLVLGVPFVCRSWYKASLDPHCWKTLDFATLNFCPYGPFAQKFSVTYQTHNFTIGGLMKFALNRGRTFVVNLLLPLICGLDILIYASNECPCLKFLGSPGMLVKQQNNLSPILSSNEEMELFFGLIAKWKDLEYLYIRERQSYTQTILSVISNHCKNFNGLKKTGFMPDEEALAIVNHLPRLRHLTVTSASMSRENLKMILEGCRELEELIVKDCCGFEVDEEILRMCSHIKKFEFEDIRLYEDERYYFPGGSPDYSDG